LACIGAAGGYWLALLLPLSSYNFLLVFFSILILIIAFSGILAALEIKVYLMMTAEVELPDEVQRYIGQPSTDYI